MKKRHQDSSSARKLTAILFADIAGYTSLMQNDEARALTILNKFKEELEKGVPAFRGEIVQFYGDGCLAVFDSPVDAMSCGKELQMIFGKEPTVPVRIGIHSGDVVYKEGNIFGDSVNVASRIESLGIPGAVLFSKRIKRHIANQKEFEVASIGEFDFKNINKTMEVFALANNGLAIPKRNEMEGKVKSTASKSASKRSITLWGVFATFLITVGYFGWQYFLNPDKDLLSEEIRSARIAVLPFENKTNDPNLNILGDMAADWITEGLMIMEDIKVVSFRNIKDNISFANEGNFASFSKATGAEKIIRGNFYLDGDEIIFQSRIVDAESGVLEKAMPQISGNIQQKTAIVKDLQQRILGYFAIKTDPYFEFLKDNPPNFEAYRVMAQSYEHFNVDYDKSIEYCNKAIEIDSNFVAPYLSILIAFTNQGQYWKADSVAQVIKQRKLHFTLIEQLVYDKTLAKEPNVKIAGSKKIFEIDPKNRFYNYDAANFAIIYNDPEESVRICQNVDLDLTRVEVPSQSLWFHVYAIALTRLNRFDKALEVLNHLPKKFEDFYYKTMVFALQGQEDSIQHMAQMLEKRNVSKDIYSFYNRAALIYGVLDDKPKQKEWAGKALHYLQQQPESVTTNNFNLARAYYLTEQYEEALSYYFELSREAEYGSLYDDKGLWNYLSRIGCIYARKGETKKALDMIEQLKAVPDPYPEGRYSYGIARIYAQLNEKEKAMEYVRKSFNEGFNTADGYRYQDDLEMLPIYDYPPFEKFMKYKREKLPVN